MAFNGSGVFQRLYDWTTDAAGGVKIRADRMDAEDDGFATGLSNAICKDGQTTITENIPFNNKRITNLGNASAATDAMNRQSADVRYLGASAITNVAGAATTDIGAAATPLVNITGGFVTITSFGTTANVVRLVKFPGVLELTHNATSLILPGGANVFTAAGDTATFASDDSGNWRCYGYQRATGTVLVGSDDHSVVELPSAATTNIGGAAKERVDISGTTTITSFGTVPNRLRFVRFTGALTLTHNATSLILQGGANVTTTANDTAIFESDGSGNWRCINYRRSGGWANLYASDGTDVFSVGTGSVTSNIKMIVNGTMSARAIYDNTTAAAANVVVNAGAGYEVLRSTSSARFKTDIEPLADSARNTVLNAQPVWYRSLCNGDNKDWSWLGFIAEEIAPIEPRLVHWGYYDDDHEEIEIENEDGTTRKERRLKEGAVKKPDGVQYERFVVPLTLVAQDHERRIASLETGGAPADTSRLEAEIETLKATVSQMDTLLKNFVQESARVAGDA